ncbi:hypothetical protein C8Q78DRAFT_1026865 [Trametes maxima]|nr:hypothetical protein C8Q78DRAFT_1026865 [Trametes maxima]
MAPLDVHPLPPVESGVMISPASEVYSEARDPSQTLISTTCGNASCSAPDEITRSCQQPTTFHQVHDDIFYLVAEQLQQCGSLSRVSQCCRRFRRLSMALLFNKCTVERFENPQVPPLTIRPYVKHVTYFWGVYHATYLKDPDRVMDGFGSELTHLPSVHSIAFEDHDVPWVAVQRCLTLCPGITNLAFRHSSTLHVPFASSLPEDLPVPASSIIEECCYPTSLMTTFPNHSRPAWLIQKKIVLEKLCLLSLVLGADRTARNLRLPIGSAPLKQMAKKDWPSMRSLVLEGEFPRGTDSQQLCTGLSNVLPRMPGLWTLVVRASVPRRTSGRISILGHPSPLLPSFSDLESLTITYPDPHDAIFSLKAPRLVKLSIRDWPRHYEVRTVRHYGGRWRSPVLAASEMLFSLRRMSTPQLTSLELVYVADDADDELLRHIVTTFPCLKYLELHRYRRPEGEHVDYEHIVKTLAEIRTLVTLRLNLDFEEDPGRCMNQVSIRRPWAHLLNERGWRAVDVLGAVCPGLEYVQLVCCCFS